MLTMNAIHSSVAQGLTDAVMVSALHRSKLSRQAGEPAVQYAWLCERKDNLGAEQMSYSN